MLSLKKILTEITKNIKVLNDAIDYNNNVLKYGADSTGATYSDIAIANCIEANKGGVIYFPAGIYLISEPIKTYDGVSKACSIIMSQDAIIKTDKTIECLFDIGAISSGDTSRYPRKTYNRIFTGGTLECTNTTYAIIFEDTSIQYIIRDMSMVDCQNGVKIGRTAALLSQDVVITDSYICGRGSNSEGIGIVIYGNDNICSNVKVYGFQKALSINGGGNIFIDSHMLAKYPSTPTKEQYELTLCAEINGDSRFDNVYSDGYYKFADIKASAYISNCIFYNYSTLSGFDVEVFKIYTSKNKITIKDCYITILPSATKSKGLTFSENFLTNGAKYYELLSNGMIIKNNRIVGEENLYDGDLITVCTEKMVYPKVYMSGSNTIELNKWYMIGWVSIPDTVRVPLSVYIGLDELSATVYVSNDHLYITECCKINENRNDTKYKIGFLFLNSVRNYKTFALCFMQTEGTLAIRNVSFNLKGIGFSGALYQELDTLFLEPSETPTDTALASSLAIIKSGKTSISATANNVTQKHIDFTGEVFSTDPIVTAIANTGKPNARFVSVNNVTTTGFDLYLYSNIDASVSISWIANGKG